MYPTVNDGPLNLNVPQAPQTQRVQSSSSTLTSQVIPVPSLFSDFINSTTIYVAQIKKCGVIFAPISPTILDHPSGPIDSSLLLWL